MQTGLKSLHACKQRTAKPRSIAENRRSIRLHARLQMKIDEIAVRLLGAPNFSFVLSVAMCELAGSGVSSPNYVAGKQKLHAFQ